ncbi:hypothetical protein ACFQ08_38500, partial [Streptosporangium algeriense]
MTTPAAAPSDATTCRYPGCEEPPGTPAGPGRPPAYCDDLGHNAVTAFRERKRLEAQARGETPQQPDDLERPVTMSQARGTELLRSAEQLAERVIAEMGRMLGELRTVTDPDAAAAEVTAD